MPETLFCPACGVKLSPGASYCRECGTHLTVGMPAVPASERLPTPEPLSAVPTPPKAPPPPPPPPEPGPEEEKKAPGFVTYLGEPVARRPTPSQAPASEPAAPPEPPAPEPVAQVAPPPRKLEPLPPERDSMVTAAIPPEPPKEPPPPISYDDGVDVPRVIMAVLAGLVVLAAIVVGIVLLLGHKKDKPQPVKHAAAPAKTAAPAKSDVLKTQVIDLDALLKRSEKGRAAAVRGDFKAAIANRSALLTDLRKLDKEVRDPQLKAALTSFTAAIEESLRQNRTCASKCPASALLKVQKEKAQTLEQAQPLLDKYGGGKYTVKDI